MYLKASIVSNALYSSPLAFYTWANKTRFIWANSDRVTSYGSDIWANKIDLFAPCVLGIRPRLHEQIKPPLIAQILDPYIVTPDEFEQIKCVLFAHVNAALSNLFRLLPPNEQKDRQIYRHQFVKLWM